MAPSGRSIRRHTASLTEPPQRDRLRHTDETSCVVEDFAVADPRPEQSLDLDRQCGTPHRSLDSAHVLGGAGEFGVAAGYCQPGQIMTAVALVKKVQKTGKKVSEADLDGLRNICRCATYTRIREAYLQGAAGM